jgi:hypothetical protein
LMRLVMIKKETDASHSPPALAGGQAQNNLGFACISASWRFPNS